MPDPLGGRLRTAAARFERMVGPGPSSPRGGRLLVLCDGNICRSPFAARLLGARLDPARFEVESAGLAAARGDPAPPLAGAAAARFGISLDGHRSRPVEAAMVAAADLILVMNVDQRRRLLAAHPAARGKVALLAHYDPNRLAAPEIADPMFGGAAAFAQTYERIASAVEGLVASLSGASSQ